MRIILDTNILVRAAKKNSPAREVLTHIKAGPHFLITAPFLLRELERALNYDRVRAYHQLSQEEIQGFVRDYHAAAEVTEEESDEPAPAISTDPDDNLILRLAVIKKVKRICTWDQHFYQPAVLAFCKKHGIRVVKDDELLRELKKPRKPKQKGKKKKK